MFGQSRFQNTLTWFIVFERFVERSKHTKVLLVALFKSIGPESHHHNNNNNNNHRRFSKCFFIISLSLRSIHRCPYWFSLVFTAQARENTFTLCQALKLCKAILGRNKPQARLYKNTCKKYTKHGLIHLYIHGHVYIYMYIFMNSYRDSVTHCYVYIYVWVIVYLAMSGTCYLSVYYILFE